MRRLASRQSVILMQSVVLIHSTCVWIQVVLWWSHEKGRLQRDWKDTRSYSSSAARREKHAEKVTGGYLDGSSVSLESSRPAERPPVLFCSTHSVMKEKWVISASGSFRTDIAVVSHWVTTQSRTRTIRLRSCNPTSLFGAQNGTQAQCKQQNGKQSFRCFHYPVIRSAYVLLWPRQGEEVEVESVEDAEGNTAEGLSPLLYSTDH